MQIMHNLYISTVHMHAFHKHICVSVHMYIMMHIYYIVLDVNRICIPPLPEDIRTRVPWY